MRPDVADEREGVPLTERHLPLQFGLSVTPASRDLSGITRLTAVAEATGLDLVAIPDHPYQPTFFETWTLLTYLAARTNEIRFIPDVLNLALRPPAMLAKAATTLDALIGGRLDLGVGAGGYADLVDGMGGVGRTGGQAVQATAESVQILRLALDAKEPIDFPGVHHHTSGYQPGPPPAHRIPIWVGGLRSRMRALTGRYADGWICPINTGLPPDGVPAAQKSIDTAARKAGREPRDVRRLYNIFGSIGPRRHGAGLHGPTDLWVDTLSDWVVNLGFDSLIFWPATPSSEQVHQFADQVAPGVRDRVAERTGGTRQP
jgi:alkanesulfonate monooxygenase SsuD/methylene tetrahydromethanopterin reductase-like flavin-dependent oxidoreductase (luciferase family)